ncbi:MAG: hypothetical protein S4CHLAM45_06420 [Chlamydiales bacterium]|nr:hypothetical protein [Chlamydiales bacterium]MCH9619818.1 hypothetical protein [Chlamydiales bacterium]MCH9622755.1 hypothetical protein [Chlamydiales bacterium]
MKVSLITPTKERDPFLHLLLDLILNQTHTDWEWLIHDSSKFPSEKLSSPIDKRIAYIYSKKDLSIGEKRNQLVDLAKGDVIFHFDDDDYYSTNYIEKVLSLMEGFHFFSAHSWFSYDAKSAEHFYFTSNHPAQTHFVLDAVSGARIREIDFGPQMRQKKGDELSRMGHGFTFAYQKEVFEKCRFPNLDIGEDRVFFEQVESQGFKTFSYADQEGIAVKMVHGENIGKIYPQYRLPSFVAKQQLPHFTSYVDRFSCRG